MQINYNACFIAAACRNVNGGTIIGIESSYNGFYVDYDAAFSNDSEWKNGRMSVWIGSKP